jgi:hypothetical protein
MKRLVAIMTFCVVLLTADMAYKNYAIYKLAAELEQAAVDKAEREWGRYYEDLPVAIQYNGRILDVHRAEQIEKEMAIVRDAANQLNIESK